MELENKNEFLTTQELEMVNDFQMEELEERMEMNQAASWLADDLPQTPGTVQGGVKIPL